MSVISYCGLRNLPVNNVTYINMVPLWSAIQSMKVVAFGTVSDTMWYQCCKYHMLLISDIHLLIIGQYWFHTSICQISILYTGYYVIPQSVLLFGWDKIKRFLLRHKKPNICMMYILRYISWAVSALKLKEMRNTGRYCNWKLIIHLT